MGYKKAFPQIVTHILQKAFFKHALEQTIFNQYYSVNVEKCQ